MRIRFDSARMQHKFLRLILAVFALFSVVSAVLGIAVEWQTPLVLLALLAIIELLNPVEEIHSDVRYLRNVHAASAPSRTFATRQEFYIDLSRAVGQATSTLDLTHIRDDPPAAFGSEAEEFTDEVTRWLQADPNHSARRIISTRTPGMLQWAQQLAKLQERLPAYHIRVVDWSIGAPALNMAIVDGQAVFLALTGDTVERTKGFAIEDTETAEYFAAYYSVLWHAATDLDEHLINQLGG